MIFRSFLSGKLLSMAALESLMLNSKVLKYTVAWAAICASLGFAGHFLLGINFWVAFLIAAIALILNGFVN